MILCRMSREALEDYAISLERQLPGILAAHQETLRRKANLMKDWLDQQRELFDLRNEVERLRGEHQGQDPGPR